MLSPALLLLALAVTAPQQDPDASRPALEGSTLQSLAQRRAAGQSLLRAYLDQAPAAAAGVAISWEAAFARSGHYARPEVLTRGRRVRVSTLGDGDPRGPVHLSSRLAEEPASEAWQTTLVGQDVFGFEELTGREALELGVQARAPFPRRLVAWGLAQGTLLDFAASADGRGGSGEGGEGGGWATLDLGQGLLALQLAQRGDGATWLRACEWSAHDSLLGDAVSRLTYAAGPGPEGVASSWSIEGELGAGEVVQGTESMDVTAQDRRAAGAAAAVIRDVDDAEAQVLVSQLGEGLYELLLPEHDARSLALALDAGWFLMEAPVASSVGEAMAQALAGLRPELPLAYVGASHHHPHYVGGMRPLVARGARVVCPEGVAGYVGELLRRPRSLHPDALSLSQQVVEVIGVGAGQRWSPPESPAALVALEGAGRSGHTDAYLLFVLPAHEIAFGGDLLWMPAEGEARRISPRTLGLWAMVQDVQDLGISQVLTSWPVLAPEAEGKRWRDRVSLEELAGFCEPTRQDD